MVNKTSKSQPPKPTRTSKAVLVIPLSMTYGVAIGTAIGVAIDNLPLGIAIGIAAGVACGAAFNVVLIRRANKKK